MYKILVIDDSESNLITVSVLLQNLIAGCSIITAQSGKDGIRKAQEELPDAILLDVMMPEMDGYDVCKILRANNITRHIPIIMLTAIGTDSESYVKGLEIGADAFLRKPIAPSELVAQVKAMLRIKKAEDDLRNSEKKYRQLVELAQEGIWAMNADSITTYANPRMAEMFGYTVEEMIGKSVFLHINKDAVEDWNKHFELSKQGMKEKYDFKFVKKDGKEIYTLLSTSPINDDKGNFVGMIALVSDITERKQVEDALRKSEKLYRTLAESANDVIYVINKDFSIEYVNSFGASLVGYKPEEVIGESIEKLFYPIDKLKKDFQKVFETGESVYNEIKLSLFEHEMWLGTILVLIKDDAGKNDTVMGIARNITRQKNVENE